MSQNRKPAAAQVPTSTLSSDPDNLLRVAQDVLRQADASIDRSFVLKPDQVWAVTVVELDRVDGGTTGVGAASVGVLGWDVVAGFAIDQRTAAAHRARAEELRAAGKLPVLVLLPVKGGCSLVTGFVERTAPPPKCTGGVPS